MRGVSLYGAGMIASVHGLAAHQLGWGVRAVASRTPERAAELAGRLHATAVGYASLPIADEVVIVSTPPAQHAEAALRLLAAGSAVVLEKPLCTTLADADAIVAASEANAGRLLYAENFAHSPIVIEFLRRARSIGPLSYVEARALQGRPGWGGFLTAAWGGGALFDLGVHPLALVLLTAGGEVPIAVRARLRGADDHETDEYAEVELSFASGLRARVLSSWQHGPDAIWDLQAVSADAVVRAELLPDAVLEHNGERIALTAPREDPLATLVSAGYVGQLAAFATDLEHHRAPVMDAEFGRWVLDIVCAAYASAGSGEAVALPFAGARDRTPLQLWRESSQ